MHGGSRSRQASWRGALYSLQVSLGIPVFGALPSGLWHFPHPAGEGEGVGVPYPLPKSLAHKTCFSDDMAPYRGAGIFTWLDRCGAGEHGPRGAGLGLG